MNTIERLFYNYGKSYDDFELLYISEDKRNVLVKNLSTKSKKKYSFGLYEDFHSIYSFPVNQSCLNKTECIRTLKRFIEINKEYNQNTNLYEAMLRVLKKDKVI